MPTIHFTSIRVSPELKALLEQTARHLGIDVSDVVRAFTIGVANGRPVIQRKLQDVYYKNPCIVMPFRNLRQTNLTPEEFRRQLALRCMEELSRPAKPQPAPRLIEGIDYVMDKEAAHV